MQRACTILPSVVCPVLQYFTSLSHTRNGKKKIIENKMYVLISSTNLSKY